MRTCTVLGPFTFCESRRISFSKATLYSYAFPPRSAYCLSATTFHLNSTSIPPYISIIPSCILADGTGTYTSKYFKVSAHLVFLPFFFPI